MPTQQSERHAPPGPSRAGVVPMFDRIAGRYDFLNRVLSLRRDVAWRDTMVRALPAEPGARVLDLATGTCDAAIAAARHRPQCRFIAVDPALEMLRIGAHKVERRGLGSTISLAGGDALHLPFPSRAFDAVTIAFGIRNVPDVPNALRELQRVLRPGGKGLVLEFSLPRRAVIRRPYLFYFRHVLPRLGALLSSDGVAYTYLNRSVESFPYGDAFTSLMEKAGFTDVHFRTLTLGVATLYEGRRT